MLQATTVEEVADLTDSIDKLVEAMVGGAPQDEAKGAHKRKVAKHSPPDLAPNREMAMAIDNALRVGGLSLSTFLPAKRLEPLLPSERRNFTELPANMQVAGTSNMRACIWDEVSGSTRVEMPRALGPDGKVFMPSLHKTCDEGSIGLPMAHWADLFVKLRSTLLEDKWHRLWNDLKSGLVSSKLWIVVCERTVVWNLMTAPFQNHGFGSVTHSAADEYFRTRSIECPIFCSLFEDPQGIPHCSPVFLVQVGLGPESVAVQARYSDGGHFAARAGLGSSCRCFRSRASPSPCIGAPRGVAS